MPKLIFVNRYFHPDHSATSQMLSDLAFDLAKDKSVQIHVVTSRQRYDDAHAELPPSEEINGISIHRVWTSRFGRQRLLGRAFDYLSFYVTAFFRLHALAGPGDTIIAKTDPPLISTVAALAAKLKSAALVNWIQDLFPEVAAALGIKIAQGPAYPALRRLRNLSLKKAKLNIAIGEHMKERLLAEGVPAGRIRVIHNWADAEQIQPVAPTDNPLRKAWGLDGKFVVGYSGNLGRGHDSATLLETATALRGQDGIVFLVIGGGAKLEGLKQAVAARQLDNFVFKPYQPREALSASLSAADVHLVSLKPQLEGLIVPSKFYGIAAAARPVLFIGDPQGEIAHLIETIGCGYAIGEGHVQELQDKILALSSQAGLKESLGTAARKSLETQYGRDMAISQWRNALIPSV